MHLTPALRWGITGQAISTTASFWAWARGLAGVMATAGVAIASAAMAEEAITVEQAALHTLELQAAATSHAVEEPSAQMAGILMLMECGQVQVIAHLAPRHRTAPPSRIAAVVKLTRGAVVKLTPAKHTPEASTNNWSMQHQTAEHPSSAACIWAIPQSNPQEFDPQR